MSKLIVKHKVKGEDIPVTTSLRVAEIFEKEHKNVIQSLENLIAENPAVKNMFMMSTYKVRGRDFKQYLITHDGFSLLVMGFTGSKALEFKLNYIKAFNEMKKELEDFKFQRKLSKSQPRELIRTK